MKDVLEKLREKPESEKQGIAFTIAGAITLVVFVLWAVYFVSELDGIEKAPALSNESASFVEQLQDGVGLFKENLSEIQGDIEGSVDERGEVFIEAPTQKDGGEFDGENAENVL